MIKIEKIIFPRDGMPTASLRLSKDTKYEFACIKCDTNSSFDLYPLLFKDFRNQFPKEMVNSLNSYFGYNVDNYFEIVKCPNCKSEFVFKINFDETSNGAYIADVNDVGILINDAT